MNNKKYLESLIKLLRIKSISTQDEYLPEMKRARGFLVRTFQQMGFTTKILKAKKHDAVYAELITNLYTLPTVLIYGHYDVQPPEPLSEWKSDPFNPVIKNEKIFARGATDNKGQFMVHLNAVKSVKNVNFKFLIEGEEEIGSISIESIAKKYKDLLKSDYIIVSDSEMLANGTPTIDISLRGLTYAEVFLEAAEHDMHSGQFGGLVENPANALANIVSALRDEGGKVLVPGFYDDVIPLTTQETKDFDSIKVSAKDLAKEGSFFKLGRGDSEYSLNERRWTRPTLDVNGITAGYQGEGSKTIISARASAKISMRLVPNQDPGKIYKFFVKYVKALVPESLKAKFVMHASALPYKSPTNDPVFALMKSCLKKHFKKEPVFTGVGGSIGFVPIVAKALKIPVLMVGWGLPDENLHAPNEHFSLNNFYGGIEVLKEFYSRLPGLKTVKKI